MPACLSATPALSGRERPADKVIWLALAGICSFTTGIYAGSHGGRPHVDQANVEQGYQGNQYSNDDTGNLTPHTE